MPLRTIGGLEILELGGSPQDMGAECGRLLKDRVQAAIHEYLRKSEEIFEVPFEYLRREAQRCLPFIPPEYVVEMEALAESSGVAFDEILAFNCLVDADGCFMQNIFNCCNFVVAPPATINGLLLHGRNIDFPPGGVLPEVAIVISRIPEDSAKAPTLSITWAGFVGALTGISGNALTCGEISVPSQDATVEGMPITFVIRGLLERCDSVDAAAEFVKSIPRTCGFNLAVSDGKDRTACGIEFTHERVGVRRPRDGVLVVDDPCLCRETGHQRLTYAAGAFRYARLMQLIQEHRGSIDIDLGLQFLRDRYDIAFARDGGKGYNCLCNSHTIHSVLFLPAARKILVAHGEVPAPTGEYRELNLDDIWGAAEALPGSAST